MKTYQQYSGQTYTLALALDGSLWREDVTNNPGVLSQITGVGILPNTFAHSITAFNREYIALNNDFPRAYNGSVMDRVSQEGPAGNIQVQVPSTANPGQATITAWSVTSGVATITCVNSFTASEAILLSLVGTPLDGLTVFIATVSGTQFTASVPSSIANGSGTQTGLATPVTTFNITSINQFTQKSVAGSTLWSAGPGSSSPGSTITVYYGPNSAVDTQLTTLLNQGLPVYVYMTFNNAGGTTIGAGKFTSGTYKILSYGIGLPVQGSTQNAYFTLQAPSVGFLGESSSANNKYQITMASVTMATPIPNLAVGNQITIGLSSSGTAPTVAAWENSWTVAGAPGSGLLQITEDQVTSAAGVFSATFTYTPESVFTPAVGDIVTITGSTTHNGALNGTNYISAIGTNTFTITNLSTSLTTDGAPVADPNAQATIVGNQFYIDPGPLYVGGVGTSSPIFGNSTGGGVAFTNVSLLVGAGTRQACVLFLTRNGYLTRPGPPVTFTVPSNQSSITVTNIPKGPPNVIARWIAFTEAGANGVPGAYFYVIPVAVETIVNGQPYTYQPTVINDNISTSATFSFVDAVLLASLEIDISGGDQFNMVELGNCQWCISYKSRMFYGLVQNKVTNFTNLSFNGGYLGVSLPSAEVPLGWAADGTSGLGISVIASSTFGLAYYCQNTSGSTQTIYGMITQSAFEDSLNVPILAANKTYGARVTARIPSGNTGGNLVVDLATTQVGTSGTVTYTVVGSFTIPFSSLTTSPTISIGTLLGTALATVPSNLVLRLYTTNMVNNADVEVDRVEIYDLSQPVLTTQLQASYINNPEAIDGVTGNLSVQSTNQQPINGAFVMYDQLYLLKQNSMFSAQDTPNSEPSGWRVQEVSNIVGTCGPESYDVGEEWCVTACRRGVYVFFGKQPVKISQEIFQVWEQIYWPSASRIWLRNDVINRRILIGVPMVTPNPWLPNAPTNSAPTSPNVVICLNYQGLGDVMALADGPQMHTTMFGTLMSVDMRRKWTLWNITSPYANFITQHDGQSQPLFICNGNASGKIYQLDSNQLSDDGAAINSLYTTYGFVDPEKAKMYPLLGFHRKIFSYLQVMLRGAGACTPTFLQNNLVPALPFSPISLPAITLSASPSDDYERPLGTPGQGPGIAGNRLFVQFSTNAVGAWFHIERLILVGNVAPLAIRGSAAQ